MADLAATKDIHRIGSGFIKAPWYGKFTGQDVPEHNKGIFAMRDAKIHAARRRLLSNPFAKSSILEWETMVHGKVHMAIDGIKRSVKEVGKADILAWLTFMVGEPYPLVPVNLLTHLPNRRTMSSALFPSATPLKP